KPHAHFLMKWPAVDKIDPFADELDFDPMLLGNPLRKFLPDKSSATISRILKRLNLHGTIRKVGKTYKHSLTRLGESVVITAGLAIRNMFVIPQLTHI
ncbi:MAG TPA: hypothetical protein PKV48_07495, partial [Thermodesulfobacteriota bacterium]|nr:hypothetical protein [Thermodesulfobacteriota bacterium]